MKMPRPIEALEPRRLLSSDPSLDGVTITAELIAVTGTDDVDFLDGRSVSGAITDVPYLDRVLRVTDGALELRPKPRVGIESIYDEAIREAGPFGDNLAAAVEDAADDAGVDLDLIFDYVDLDYRKLSPTVAQARTEIDLPGFLEDVIDVDGLVDERLYIDVELTGDRTGRVDAYDEEREYGFSVAFEVSGEGFTDPIVSNPLGDALSFDGRTLTLDAGGGDNKVGVRRDDAGRVLATVDDRTAILDTAGVSTFVINAGDGDDEVYYLLDLPGVLSGGDGDDYVLGGTGDDTLDGGAGRDTLSGAAGRNRIFGGDGPDRLNGSGGRDFLFGEGGDDRLYGRGGNDRLDGGGGVDRLFAGDGDDYLDGGSSYDKLYGDAGDDTLGGGRGRDLFNGGAGDDLGLIDDEDDLSGDFFNDVEATQR